MALAKVKKLQEQNAELTRRLEAGAFLFFFFDFLGPHLAGL